MLTAPPPGGLAPLWASGYSFLMIPFPALALAAASAFLAAMSAQAGTAGRDEALETRRFEQAALKGDRDAMSKLACRLADGTGTAPAPKPALRWLRKAAEAGHPNAQFNLGAVFDEGDAVAGVRADPAAAFRWYRRAAKSGSERGQVLTGFCYWKGIGIKRDVSQARFWFEKAASAGQSDAQFMLGYLDETGDDAAPDLAKALEWYRLAAAQGGPKAQFRIGLMYSKGQIKGGGLPESVTWLRKAAEQGYPEAQYNIGLAYYYGRGVAASPADAYAWLSLARENAMADANEPFEELSRKITAADRAAGKRLAEERRRPVPVMFKDKREPC